MGNKKLQVKKCHLKKWEKSEAKRPRTKMISKKMQGPKNETQKTPSEKLACLKKWWGPKNRKQKGELKKMTPEQNDWDPRNGKQKTPSEKVASDESVSWKLVIFLLFLAVAGSQVRMRHLQILESRVTRWKGKLHFFFGTFYSGRLPSENARISRWTFYFAIDPNETVTLASKKCNQETGRVPFFFVVGGWSHERLR